MIETTHVHEQTLSVPHEVHHEVELAVILGKDLTRPACRNIKDDHILMREFIGGYACALDLTESAEQKLL